MEATNISEDTLLAALSYAEQNIPVFPCKPDKSPDTPHAFYDATTEEGQIRAWWANLPEDLIGLVTGEKSGVFVLDVDGEEGRKTLEVLEAENETLPDTYEVKTRSGGRHLYFRYPGVRVKSTNGVIGPRLDVKGDGGYVIAPPSPGYGVVSGEFGEFTEAPEWLVELVRGDRDTGRARPLPEKIPQHERNTSLTSLAGSMRQRNASMATILAALNEENQQKCNPPLPWREIVTIARSASRYAPGSLPLTELGNAERLVGRHGHDLIHVYGIGWFVWCGTHWRRDKSGEVDRRAVETVRSIHEEAAIVVSEEKRKALSKWAVASESAYKIKAMIELARSMPGVPVEDADSLDEDPWLLNLQNGTLDLRTGELRDHRREDLITKLAPVGFDPEAQAPTWEAFLERVLPSEETRTFLKRAVGYSLTGRTTEKVMPCLLGPGDSGKTTFVEAIMDLMGEDYAKPAAPDLLLAKRDASHPTEVADLLGRRFVASVEVEEGRYLAESLVKQLTGGDRISARFMRQDFFEFSPTHKIWLAANHPPIVRGGDDAIWNRIKKVPFGVVIPKGEQDGNLRDKLRAERSGILNWALEGCLE
ncbi:MAG: phage/plasmid primase, P4 family [Actinomycetota bacterium]|nr:phage/plasmid primase, P4 family [Actinomycetota bacterium]